MMHQNKTLSIGSLPLAAPRLLIPNSFGLPPLESCFGRIPSQADTCRPLLNAWPSPRAATIAVAMSGPTPGIVPNF
jgi:hypothetical protein